MFGANDAFVMVTDEIDCVVEMNIVWPSAAGVGNVIVRDVIDPDGDNTRPGTVPDIVTVDPFVGFTN
jgi:hypothetical protein